MKYKKTIASSITILLTAITSIIAYKLEINPPLTNVIGAFVSIFVVIIISNILKFKDNMFFLMLIFVYLASPLGSVINLYRTFALYDKIVHFISGILLAAIGMVVVEKILSTDILHKKSSKNIVLTVLLFSFIFSSAGAGIWEIFEFIADKLAGGGMQRGMVDTLTDMIAGNIGGLLYLFISLILVKSKQE